MRFSRAEALIFFRVQNLVVEKFRGIFIWFVMKISDGTPTTEPLYWEKSLAEKGSLDCYKQRS